MRWLTLLGSIAVLVLACAFALPFRGYVVDDAFISYRYADNVAAGLGWCYNPSQVVEAYSNHLFILILAVLRRLGLAPPVAGQIIGLATHLTVILLVITWSIHELDSRSGLIPGFILACTSASAYWSVAGLETPLHTLVLTALVMSIAGFRKGSTNAWLVRTPLACLLVISRTEGVVYAGVLMTWCAVREMIGSSERVSAKNRDPGTVLTSVVWKRGLVTIMPAILCAVAYHGWRLATFGSLVSTPARIKRMVPEGSFVAGARYLSSFSLEYLCPLLVVGLLLAFVRPRMVTIGLGLLIFAKTMVVLGIGGDWMPLYRLLVPLYPLAIVEAWRGLSEFLTRTRISCIALGGGLLLTCWQLSYVPHRIALDMAAQSRLAMLQEYVADELRQRYEPSSLLAVGDVGRIGYFSGLPILDIKGLVSPEVIAFYRLIDDGSPRYGIEPQFVIERAPDLMLLLVEVSSSGPSRGVFAPDDDLLAHAEIFTWYREVGRFCGRSYLLSVEYLLLERLCPTQNDERSARGSDD